MYLVRMLLLRQHTAFCNSSCGGHTGTKRKTRQPFKKTRVTQRKLDHWLEVNNSIIFGKHKIVDDGEACLTFLETLTDCAWHVLWRNYCRIAADRWNNLTSTKLVLILTTLTSHFIMHIRVYNKTYLLKDFHLQQWMNTMKTK